MPTKLEGKYLGQNDDRPRGIFKVSDPPQPPLRRGEPEQLKVPLFKGDLGGSRAEERI
jgi:hypothetical protein